MPKTYLKKGALAIAVTLSLLGISNVHADCMIDPSAPGCMIGTIPEKAPLGLGVAFEPVLDENKNHPTGAVIPVITTLDFMAYGADLTAYNEAIAVLEQEARLLTENDLGAVPAEYQFSALYDEFRVFNQTSANELTSRALTGNYSASAGHAERTQRYATDTAYRQAIDDLAAHRQAYRVTYGGQIETFFNAAPQRGNFATFAEYDAAFLTYAAGLPTTIPTFERYMHDYITADPILQAYVFANEVPISPLSNNSLVFYGPSTDGITLNPGIETDFDRLQFALAAYSGMHRDTGISTITYDVSTMPSWYSIQDFAATLFEAANGYGKTDYDQETTLKATNTQEIANWYNAYNTYFGGLFHAAGITPPQEAAYVKVSNEMRLGGISDPINDTDAANKRYVDNAVSNIKMNGNPYVAVDGDTPAEALGKNSVAIGNNARALEAGGIAIGDNALAESEGSVAIGAGAYARSSVAVGAGAQATGNKTTAIGDNAVASGAQAVALGNEATATGDNSVAIGNHATASGTNSVAIGANTSTSRNNTVSIGGRTLSDVARPVHGTDAANKAYVDEQIDISQMRFLGDANAYTDRQINALDKKLSAGIAAMAAQPSLPALAPGEAAVAVGTGHYNGQSALGIGFGYARDANTQFYGGISAGTHSSAKPVFRAGASWKF